MGKSKTGQFVRLEYAMLDSPAWRRLTRAERDAYIYFRRARNRRVNGRTINPFDSHVEYGHSDCPVLSSHAFTDAMAGLRVKGFVQLVSPGRFPNVKAVYAVSDKWRGIGVQTTPISEP